MPGKLPHSALTTSRLCIAVTLCIAFSATPTAAEEAVLNIYNWSDYIGETTIADFEQEYGIKVNYDIYDSASIVDAKLMAGRSGYDVVIHSASFSTRLQEAGIFMELSRDKLDNWRHLDPELLTEFGQYDPGNRYAVPYMWGTTGFTYNKKMLLERLPDAPLHSAELVFNPEVVKHFADCGVSILEAPTDVIPSVLLYLGRDPNSFAPEDLKAAEQVLQSIRPYIKYYSSTKFMLDLPAGEVCLAGTWSGDYAVASIRAAEAGLDIKLDYTIPTEGATLWFDAVYIPADAPHPDNAHLFLNYLLRPEVIADISNFTGYANANAAATALVLPEYANDPAIYPDAEVLKRTHAVNVGDPKTERLRTRAWTRAKSGL
ncbi:MAG: polyamine ABC transporter substrate-binding protein [Halieaceae bacterium]